MGGKFYLMEWPDGKRDYVFCNDTNKAIEYCRKHKCKCLNLITAIQM